LPASLGLTDGDQGAAVDIIGCGLTDPSNTSSFGTRMHISETISAVAGADGCSSANASVTAWSICYDVSAGGPAQADSGGPALLVRSGTTYVAAVTSGNVHGTKVGVSTRVDHFYESFISLKANGDACVAGAECQSGSCASSVCCDTPCGACHVCSIAAGASQDGHCEARSGGSCDDGNPCTVNDTCTSGSCAGTPKCGAGPCRLAGTCDPTTGECVPGAALADGTPCDDQDPCTLGDSCVSGECTGTPKDCAGKCRTASACDHATGNCLGISPDGTSCDDGNGCTQGDSCQAGACIAGAAVNTCPAPDACHDGSSCEPATGQCTPFPAKADGAKCEAGTCRGGVCVPSTRVGCSAAGSGQTMLLGAALGAFGLLRRRRTAGLQCLRR
jgi:hypothetical protein